MDGTDDIADELRDQLDRHPADRYPVQHATDRFHLGTVLLDRGEADAAASELGRAVELFEGRLDVEHAKSLVMLGIAERDRGRPTEARGAFEKAVSLLSEDEQPEQRAAALFNLGLSLREAGENVEAGRRLIEALIVFEERGLLDRASAAAREAGTVLLELGDLDGAVEALEAAVSYADEVGDHQSLGAAANALGIAHLAADQPEAAAECFVDAAAAHPRSVRPEGYAMAKANLALAAERLDDLPRARVAAKQARDAPAVPTVAAEQAEEVLARVGADGGLVELLAGADRDAWPALVREELIRLADLPQDQRRRDLGALLDGHLQASGSPFDGTELAETWLGALLELPPEPMEDLILSILTDLVGRDPETQDRIRRDVSRAIVRFHSPQLLRLQEIFDRRSAEVGLEQGW